MSFEEQFPSLKDLRYETDRDAHSIYGLYNLEDLEKHCLDKQRVKEILLKEIHKYLILLHTQPSDVNAEYARGWKDATSELLHSIKDKEGYMNKELRL